MKKYFTISEFAKLRDININSLRYYEKIGVLKPIYIDENTHYRYYSIEQLFVLNQIILCITIGIPLKEMVHYLDDDGQLQSKKLLERGKMVALEKMKEIQENLDLIEYMLDNIEEDKKFENREGTYVKHMKERWIITTDYYYEWMERKQAALEISEIYKVAQKNGALPILPAGQILELDEHKKIKYRFFIEIISQEKSYPKSEILPTGEYVCMQTSAELEENLVDIIYKNWEIEEGTKVILSNVRLEKYNYENKPSEIQVRRR